jgi:hypothetical protein
LIHVPQSTVERPITVIDYIAQLAQCGTLDEVRQYASAVPLDVRQDDRFNRAVAGRLGEIRGRK